MTSATLASRRQNLMHTPKNTVQFAVFFGVWTNNVLYCTVYYKQQKGGSMDDISVFCVESSSLYPFLQLEIAKLIPPASERVTVAQRGFVDYEAQASPMVCYPFIHRDIEDNPLGRIGTLPNEYEMRQYANSPHAVVYVTKKQNSMGVCSFEISDSKPHSDRVIVAMPDDRQHEVIGKDQLFMAYAFLHFYGAMDPSGTGKKIVFLDANVAQQIIGAITSSQENMTSGQYIEVHDMAYSDIPREIVTLYNIQDSAHQWLVKEPVV